MTKPVDGSLRMILCSACNAMSRFEVYTRGKWIVAEMHVPLIKINNVHVCDTNECKRKAKLKAFW